MAESHTRRRIVPRPGPVWRSKRGWASWCFAVVPMVRATSRRSASSSGMSARSCAMLVGTAGSAQRAAIPARVAWSAMVSRWLAACPGYAYGARGRGVRRVCGRGASGAGAGRGSRAAQRGRQRPAGACRRAAARRFLGKRSGRLWLCRRAGLAWRAHARGSKGSRGLPRGPHASPRETCLRPPRPSARGRGQPRCASLIEDAHRHGASKACVDRRPHAIPCGRSARWDGLRGESPRVTELPSSLADGQTVDTGLRVPWRREAGFPARRGYGSV